jgi:hypothetical protein
MSPLAYALVVAAGLALLVVLFEAIGVEIVWDANRVTAGLVGAAILTVVALTWEQRPATNLSYRALFSLLMMGVPLTWFGEELGARGKVPGVVMKIFGWVLLAGSAYLSIWLGFFFRAP